jgi:superfamily II DNA or RNA helicase
MDNNPFQTREPAVIDNPKIRTPQKEAYSALVEFAASEDPGLREVGIVLPVGCGKSGTITLTPFAFKAKRTLVIAPGLNIADQLEKEFNPSQPDMFYLKCGVLNGQPYPEPVEIRGTASNLADLEEADVVITNIAQLQGGGANRWLQQLSNDFFDLILFDEGHHNVAASWEGLRAHFPSAKIVNFSATPARADGQLMAGRIIYSYPIFRAIQEGYVKRLKAVVLNPRTLRYVREEDGQEIEVTLDEVRRLGEEDADFRRTIVTSKETLNTIVDASIRELQKLRANSGEQRLKIIASALNYTHCGKVVEAYRSRDMKADYVHSQEDSRVNDAILKKLENHELDVIVQVRKLGEGFDHKYLAVAAVFSVFSNLSPFVQFVGRIMRVVKQNAPGHVLNNGVVVFHAGANIARRWADFQSYTEADQDFFDQLLLPVEELDFQNAQELEIEPQPGGMRPGQSMEVRSQSDVRVEEIPLMMDEEAVQALRILQQKGYTAAQVSDAYQILIPVPVTKVKQRQAKRGNLDMQTRTAAASILKKRKVNPMGNTLDKKRLGRTNLVVMISAISKQINDSVSKGAGKRDTFTKSELDQIELNFNGLVAKAEEEVFGGD